MPTDLSKFDNSWYNTAPALKRVVWYFFNLIFFQTGLFPFYSLKTFLLRVFGARVGKGVLIKPCVNIKYPWNLSIGDHCWIGEKVWIDNLAPVLIESQVCISQGAYLLTGNHDYTKTAFDLFIKPIHISKGVWIGAKSVVCPGVTCHEHSILAVQSVANRDMEPFTIYMGNPAVKVRLRNME